MSFDDLRIVPPPDNPSWLVVHVMGSPIRVGQPRVYIDGSALSATYGPNEVKVEPGHHTVRVESVRKRTYGLAAMEVEVPLGRTVDVYYAGPFGKRVEHGNIGLVEQQRPDHSTVVGAGIAVGVASLGALVLAIVVTNFGWWLPW